MAISAGTSYIVWLIVFIIVLLILRAFRIQWFSAIVFSLLLAWLVLVLIFPIEQSMSDGSYMHDPANNLLGIIGIVTWILAIIYVIVKVFSDRETDDNNDCGSCGSSSGNIIF